MTEKMTEQLLIRLTPTMLDRIETTCKLRGLDKTETCRGAIIAEIQRLEEQITPEERQQLDQLSRHGLTLAEVVESAVARKMAEDAQMSLPAMNSLAPTGS